MAHRNGGRGKSEMDIQASSSNIPSSAASLYGTLEERITARDQVGAGQAYYEQVRAGRPLPEIIAEDMRVHAPYTNPHKERLGGGRKVA
jgi:hypothetical protein